MVAVLVSILLSACGGDTQELSQETSAEFLAALSSHPGSQPFASVSLSWDAVSDPTVQGYRIYFGLDTGRYILHRTVGTVTAITMAVPRGLTWHVAVTAYNEAGESPYSEEVLAIVPLL